MSLLDQVVNRAQATIPMNRQVQGLHLAQKVKRVLLGDKQPPTESSLFSMLRGQLGAGSVLAHPAAYPLTTIEPGIACGRLLGGNLSSEIAPAGMLLPRPGRFRISHVLVYSVP